MFLYIGGVTNILADKIISIHNYNKFIMSGNMDIIEKAKNDKSVIFLAEIDDIKSVVITDSAIYLSAISENTLRKRADKNYNDKETQKYINDYLNDRVQVFSEDDINNKLNGERI